MEQGLRYPKSGDGEPADWRAVPRQPRGDESADGAGPPHAAKCWSATPSFSDRARAQASRNCANDANAFPPLMSGMMLNSSIVTAGSST